MLYIICFELFCSDQHPAFNSLQGNKPLCKRPKPEEDEEFAEFSGEEGANPAMGPRHLKVTEKPEKALKLGKLEESSAKEALDTRIQVDQSLLNDTKLSGKKIAGCLSHVTRELRNLTHQAISLTTQLVNEYRNLQMIYL